MQTFAPQIAAQAAPRRFAVAGSWCAELLPQSPYATVYTPEGPIVGFAFDGQVGIHAFGSDHRTGFRAKPNGLAYVPAGCDVYSESPHGGEYLKITFAPAVREPSPCAPRFSDVIDRVAIVAARRLRRLLLTSGGIDLLQCERFVHLLRERVSALGGIVIKPSPRSCMTPYRLRLIDDLIQARLDDKLTVQELAGALGLSTAYFSRAFKAAIGKAPHDHIVDCRISRARALLQSTKLDLSAIAQASGFASHAHMTATFRDRLGINPTVLRKGLTAYELGRVLGGRESGHGDSDANGPAPAQKSRK
jgi:AraC family transcriptional regulator